MEGKKIIIEFTSWDIRTGELDNMIETTARVRLDDRCEHNDWDPSKPVTINKHENKIFLAHGFDGPDSYCKGEQL